MTPRFVEVNHVTSLLVPVADVFAGTKTTDEVKMSDFDHATFLVISGANAGDEPIFTVESCSDTSGTNNTAIPFDYTSTTGTSTATSKDVWANYGRATATGYSKNSSAINMMWAFDVDAAELSQTNSIRHEYIRLVCTESGSSGITGAVICILSNARFAKDGKSTQMG